VARALRSRLARYDCHETADKILYPGVTDRRPRSRGRNQGPTRNRIVRSGRRGTSSPGCSRPDHLSPLK